MERPIFLTCKVPIGAQGSKERALSEEKLCIFQTRVNNSCQAFSMAVLGSVPQLGCWDRTGPVIATYKDPGIWLAKVKLPVDVDIEYKWILYDKYESRIIEYETGENRKVRVDSKSLLIQDFCDGVQKITELLTPETDHFLHGTKNGCQYLSNRTDISAEESAQKTQDIYLPTGWGPFQYDEHAVKLLKNLNPRIYVPDEYTNGTLKESCSLGKYKKDESTKQFNVHSTTKDIIQEEDIISLESSVYGQELARIFAENEKSTHINDGLDLDLVIDETVPELRVDVDITGDKDENNSGSVEDGRYD